jgi:transposase
MPWTEITREQYRRDELRYASDMTDAEWGLIKPFLPRAHRRGRPRRTDLRSVVEAILYILSTGCQWRALPQEFPPYSTVQGYFYAWRDTGRWQRIVNVLVRRARKKLGRAPRPTAAVIDSQSAPTTQAGGPRGYDAGKAHLRPQAAYCDRYQRPASWGSCSSSQRPGLPWRGTAAEEGADTIPSAGPRLCRPDLSWEAASRCALGLRSMDHRDRRAAPGVKGFQLLPRGWVVERTFAWFGRCRRLAKDFEAAAATEVAWLLVAHIRLLTRRLAAVHNL